MKDLVRQIHIGAQYAVGTRGLGAGSDVARYVAPCNSHRRDLIHQIPVGAQHAGGTRRIGVGSNVPC
jgi:hypothetical protein